MFICLFLHQTTTWCCSAFSESKVFICLFLHQTTTVLPLTRFPERCLSVYSYIKPQRVNPSSIITRGVYLSIPTSNHNGFPLHSRAPTGCLSVYSYIKPQRKTRTTKIQNRCLSVYSYIKPQHGAVGGHAYRRCLSVYSYIKPQP